jgi:heme o synthase
MNTVSDIIDLPDASAAVANPSPAPAALASTLSAARTRAVDLYELTKPRMNFLVVVTTMVGFYMAARGNFADWRLLAHTLLGTALAAAGASVLNQYIERGYDGLMRRTNNRPLPAGAESRRSRPCASAWASAPAARFTCRPSSTG